MKIRIQEKKRRIIIDEYHYIGGAIVPKLKCEKCDSIIIYYDRYDNEFCPSCNQWITPPCGDSDCIFCSRRPEQPLEIRTLADM